MRLLIAVMGTAGLASIVLVLLILARLTQKWESVTRSKSGFRLFYIAAALISLASLVRLVRIGYLFPPGGGYSPIVEDLLTASRLSALKPIVPNSSEAVLLLTSAHFEPQSWFYVVFYHLPLAIAVTGSLVLAWRNWGWLLRESDE